MKRETMIAFIYKNLAHEKDWEFELLLKKKSNEEIKILFEQTKKRMIDNGKKGLDEILKSKNYKRKK